MENQNNNETTTVVNNDITDRLRKSYIAQKYTAFDEKILMIEGKNNDGSSIDILITWDGVEDMANLIKSAEVAKAAEDKERENAEIAASLQKEVQE